MFFGCPLCNGVDSPGICPNCGVLMEDLGVLENFFGPYDPYEDESDGSCVHLICCPNCHYDFRQKVQYHHSLLANNYHNNKKK
ncbi:MAG: hypothetical protein ACOYI2_06400 [Bacillota bacterium]|jgi:hypothetical protein|nr:hypothetical protein [Clostridia bacterium]